MAGSSASAEGLPELADNAPEDCPTTGTVEWLLAAVEDLSPQAMEQWPGIRSRFEAGLPEGEHLFVTTILEAEGGPFEYIFVSVNSLRGTKLIGQVASEIMMIPGVRHGDPITIMEEDIADWVISKPDGSEEGNRIGLALEHYSACDHDHTQGARQE